MPAATALRAPAILPFFNLYTVVALVVWTFAWLLVKLGVLDSATGVEHLYLLILVQLLPVVLSFTRKHFTYISFVMMNHFVAFSMPKWFQFNGFEGVPKMLPKTIEAVQEQMFCTVLMILVYYALRIFIFNAAAEKEKYQYLTLKKWQLLCLGAYVIVVPLFIYELPSWFLTVHFLLMSADVIMLFTSVCPGSETLMRWIKVAVFAEALEYFLNTGMMTMMGALVSFFFLISCMEKRYWRVLLIALGVVAMSAIQSVKASYRDVIRTNDLSIAERAGVLYELLVIKYVDEGELLDEEEADVEQEQEENSTKLLSGFMRAGDDSMERVLEYTPERVPYWNGETYASLPYMFIPRALWPDKPSRHFWNKYGRMYGVLSSNDYETSVGISYLAEGYINFSYHGMYIVALFMGLLIAAAEKAAHVVLGGYFFFPFIILLTPMLAPGTDMGSVLQSLWILTMFLFGARPILAGMAQRDDYG
jgi:hypothetical protein